MCIFNAQAETGRQSPILHPKGLLWKIEKPGMVPSHLYGTMHVGDPRVVNLAAPVEQVFVKADHFVMEMLLNFRAVGVITSGSFFNDGRTLASVMQPEQYQQLLQIFKQQLFLPEKAINNMRPWAVLMALMVPGQPQVETDSAVDMVLYRRAALRKIPLMGLESPEEQLAVFESLSIEEQVWMLNKSVQEYGRYGSQMTSMLEAYLDRDLAALAELQEQFSYEESDIDDKFMYELIDKRNTRMVQRMQPVLQQGNAFIAIGALHLPGEKGVLHLLEQQGYSVSPVY
ncbi:MAG: TraB/GumN family protein [Gammaproteobacteria bacterium]|nr:TraB/GumN family protein [Gammaproteobacteria bacterium]